LGLKALRFILPPVIALRLESYSVKLGSKS
jgi:hypothetical protein